MTQRKDNANDFCVAVAAHPTGRIDVQGEADMVRSCILYADRVHLYSPTASLILQVSSAIKRMSHEEAIDLLHEFIIHTKSSTADMQMAALLRQAAMEPKAGGWTKRAERQRMLRRKVDGLLDDMAETARVWSSSSAFTDLKLAENRGILSFACEYTPTRLTDQVADFVIAASRGRARQGAVERDRLYKEAMLTDLLRSVTNDFEYPLLDREVQGLVRQNRMLGLQDNTAAQNRSKVAGLGGNIFGRLPVPQAPMDELLDLREELGSVVSRFRRGLLNASAEIQSAQWGETFISEASYTYDRHVAPALEELEDILKSTPAFHSFFSVSASAAKSLGSVGGVYLIADKLLQIRPELGVALGLTAAVATFVFDQVMASQGPSQKARVNDWFLVYQARNSLEHSTSK